MVEYFFVWLLMAFAVVFVVLHVWLITTAVIKAVFRRASGQADLEPKLAPS